MADRAGDHQGSLRPAHPRRPDRREPRLAKCSSADAPSILARAPQKDKLLELLEPIYADDKLATLVEFNVALLREVVSWLGIATRLVMASRLDAPGSSSRLMLNLTRAVGGDVYLSGPTGRRYLEPDMFSAVGVELATTDSSHSSTLSSSGHSS